MPFHKFFNKKSRKDFKELIANLMELVEQPSALEAKKEPGSSEHEKYLSYIQKNYKKDGDVNDVDKNGFTRLSWAAYYKDLRALRNLLSDKKVNLDIIDNYGQTALIRAGSYGHFDICKILIHHKANPFIEIPKEYEDSISALSQACKQNEVEIVKSILDHPLFDVNSDLAKTCFIATIRQNAIDCFKVFLDKNINIDFIYVMKNFSFNNQYTPLILAISDKRNEIAKMLIAKGADLFKPVARVNNQPISPVACAFAVKSIMICRLILEKIISNKRHIKNPLDVLNAILACEITAASTDEERADAYFLLKLLFTENQFNMQKKEPQISTLNERDLARLQNKIYEIASMNAKKCNIVSTVTALPDPILSIIDEYNHPHSHLHKSLKR